MMPIRIQLLRRLAPLVMASALGFVLLAIRRLWIGHGAGFGFLAWNLFLAWLPLGFAGLALRQFRNGGARNPAMWLAGTAWLLFLPNAPYLVTDLVHWKRPTPAPEWLDLLVLVHFAGLGVWLGFASLRPLQAHLAGMLGMAMGRCFALAALMASGFGVYLGRFRRWNSWDVITSPMGLGAEIAERVLQPWEHPRAWGFTLAFGTILACAYWLGGERDPSRESPGLSR